MNRRSFFVYPFLFAVFLLGPQLAAAQATTTPGSGTPPPQGTSTPAYQPPAPQGTSTPSSQPPRRNPDQQNQDQQNTDNGDNARMQNRQMDKAQQQQQQHMAGQIKQMTKQLQNAITLFTKAQAKLQKSGLSLSSDCTQALADAQTSLSALQSGATEQVDPNTLGDAMMSLQQCRVQASQLTQAPVVMKTLTRAHDKLLKKNLLYDTDKQDWDILLADYATIKSGSFDDSDVFSFFDDARTIAENYGINSSSIPQARQPQNNEQNGANNNMGAAVSDALKNIGGFLGGLVR